MKNAFCLIHFGSNIKYFELELYFILMLKNNTKNDCIYLYSINDTPQEWVDIMKNYFDKVISFDDKNITYNIDFESKYSHFNTLRTCDYIFAYNLIEYSKICIVESDMVIVSNIDDIFLNKTPAVLFVHLNKTDINNNNIVNFKPNYENCSKESQINGGILLFKPNINKFKHALNELKNVIKYNCIYPNEELFLMSEYKFSKNIYNIPIIYNYCHYNLHDSLNIKPIKIVHFNESKFKYLDIIKSGYKNKIKKKVFYVEFFKKNYYDKYSDIINDIIKLL